jgi:hypothetical protein
MILIFKLTTGEEVLGEMVNATLGDFYYSIKNPVAVAVVRGKDGQPNVGFAPFPIHSEQKKDFTIDIPREHVVYSYTPAEDFINNYNQIFGSGIVLPSKQLITG